MRRLLIIIYLVLVPGISSVYAQIDEEKLGTWYMYFWNTTIGDSQWGFQGDLQHRNWNIIGDLEQLLLRGGLTYQPQKTSAKFTMGVANISTGTFGPETSTMNETRIYQEALLKADTSIL